ncbi:hypothetical protein [Endomicrobium proavitum]|uniref:Uncharacterized protein n=1 Tax=Endomicrobium proavitum TaxID=1408281 RepID=A0A0G3WHT6_9BACT|nr:hypothetical protein [Endomicrobium proavitum]AKL98231.1 hypothetical protein Epro_0852 [Endomicrobium proavitum]
MIIDFDKLDFSSIYYNFSFTELLFSIKIGIAKDFSVDNYLKGNGYQYDDLKKFLYKLSFFEKADLLVCKNRILYLYLMKLKQFDFNAQELSLYVDYICGFFKYPEGTEGLIYYMPARNTLEKQIEEWTIYNALSKYLEKYKNYINFTVATHVNHYDQLFCEKFAFIKSKKYKSCFITGTVKNHCKCLYIWSDNILTVPIKSEICFKNDNEIKEFLTNKDVYIYALVNNNYFLDENYYISDFKEKFDNSFEKIIA